MCCINKPTTLGVTIKTLLKLQSFSLKPPKMKHNYTGVRGVPQIPYPLNHGTNLNPWFPAETRLKVGYIIYPLPGLDIPEKTLLQVYWFGKKHSKNQPRIFSRRGRICVKVLRDFMQTSWKLIVNSPTGRFTSGNFSDRMFTKIFLQNDEIFFL